MTDSTPLEDDPLKTDLHIQAAYRLTEALGASEKKLRRRIELLSEVVFEIDSSGLLRFLNGAWNEILGFNLEISLGTPLQHYVLAADKALLSHHLEATNGARRREEIRFVSASGSVVTLEMSTRSLDEGGMVGTLHDVTERNATQAELAKLSLVASFTDSLVVITDADGKTEWVNQAFVKKTGYSLEESVGRKPGSFLQGPDTDRATVQSIGDNLRDRKSFHCEILNYTKSGEEYWMSIFVTPIFNPQGHLERFIAVQNDITLVRQMQHDLHVAKEAAERASQAKSVFLAAMSHEIRTPLNGVLGMVSLLLDGRLDDDQRQRANIIKNSGEALVTIVNDILDYSKIESGRFSLTSEPFSARSVLDDTVNLFKGNAETKGISLVGKFSGDESFSVLGDRGRLRQVLMNLVSNAVKFTNQGEVSVEVDQQRVGDEVEIQARVRDTGIGVAPDDLGRLFVHFSQIDGSATRKHGGTGLGLAISKQLVEMMGGTIGVQTDLQKGSTFWFSVRLPCSQLTTTPQSTESNGEILDFRGLHALIAEDNGVNQIVLRGILGLLGCHVDVAINGVEAVEMVRKTPYDFVLMDVHMPEMDGLEATREIRTTSQIPIIAVTANVLPEHIEVCFESGMNGFVPKPISKHSIQAELVRVLTGHTLPRLDAAKALSRVDGS